MKTQTDQRWDDIVFENRNKTYGAYAIRQSYPVNVLRALLLCGGGVAGVFLLPSHTTQKIVTDEILTEVFAGPTTPPIIKPETPPKKVAPAKENKTTLLPTRVTTKEIHETEIIEFVETGNSSTGDTNGTAVETISGNGFGNIPIVTESVKPPEFLLAAEVMPSYEGGFPEMMKFIQNKMSRALYVDVTGTVYVSFVVSATGAVTRVEIIKGIDKRCDQEAIRVISMMKKWKPGTQNKMPVAVRLVLPIKFVASE